MSASALFKPLQVGKVTLKNRIIMAPLTRCRATPVTYAPNEMMIKYYGARGDAGLIVSEATVVSELGRGFPNTPGIYSEVQRDGWKKVVDAVHSKGGAFAIQLWHQGRTASRELMGQQPIGPSAIKYKQYTGAESEVPREIKVEEIPGIIAEYVRAARLAIDSGADFVEVHGANGYLPHQFLSTSSNTRTDAYGGSHENRARFLLEIMAAVSAEIGADKTGLRISPAVHFQEMYHEDPVGQYEYLAKELEKLKPAYVHVIEPRDSGMGGYSGVDTELTAAMIKKFYTGPVFSAGGHTKESGEEYVASGKADAVVYGKLFIANPDLVQRFAKGQPASTAWDMKTFYGGGETGYLTYKTYEEEQAAASGATSGAGATA